MTTPASTSYRSLSVTVPRDLYIVRLHCPYMKVTGLQDIYFALADERFEIQLDDDVIDGARRALDRMLAVPRDD